MPDSRLAVANLWINRDAAQQFAHKAELIYGSAPVPSSYNLSDIRLAPMGETERLEAALTSSFFRLTSFLVSALTANE